MAEKNLSRSVAALSPPSPGSPTVSHEEDIHAVKDHPSDSDDVGYAEHGPGIDHQITQENVIESHKELLWSRIRHAMKEPFSEFLGVFILILFGDGVVAQVVLSDGEKGSYQSISWGWGYVWLLVLQWGID
jgi:aquaglyceroporin related protein